MSRFMVWCVDNDQGRRLLGELQYVDADTPLEAAEKATKPENLAQCVVMTALLSPTAAEPAKPE